MPPTSRISPPLPLPVGFALLPSSLPGQQLTPLLYSELNGLPIYLTLSPSHTPHISFLPILLALRNSYTPLSLLVDYGLSSNEYSLDVDGVAPWADLWIPLDIARRVIRDLGASRLFWDEQGRGLLGKVGDAVSWEEAGGWYHNWLPAKSHVPSSSYSLDTLLGRSWSFIEVIPYDRCVFTPAGKQRIARLKSEAMSNDPSRLRAGVWGSAWDAVLGWTIQSWSEYRSAPSKLPESSRRKRRRRPTPVIDLLNSMSTLFGGGQSSISLDPSDLARLTPSLRTVPTIAETAYQLLLAIFRTSAYLVPALSLLAPASLLSKADPRQAQWHARLQLALCSLLSDIVVGLWRVRRENDRLRAALASRGDSLPADMSIPPARERVRATSRPTSSTSSEELDVLVELERRRGGSPPPVERRRKRRRKRVRPVGHTARQDHSGSSSSAPEAVQTAGHPQNASTRPKRFTTRSSSTAVDVDEEASAGRNKTIKESSPIALVTKAPPIPTKKGDTSDAWQGQEQERNAGDAVPPLRGDGPNGDRLEDRSANGPSTAEGDAHTGSDHPPDKPPDPSGQQRQSRSSSQTSDHDKPEGEEADEVRTDESTAGSVVDSVVHRRRIHPWPTVIFSLLAVIAAYLVLLHGGPATSNYG